MESEPSRPYVYQPKGPCHPADRLYAEAGRLWGVSGIHPLARIEGLTKQEAEAIVEVLNQREER